MKNPLRISFRRRTPAEAPGAEAPTAETAAAESATAEQAAPASAPAEPLPAGADPEERVPARATFRNRARLRRRMRYLRRARELGFRDLGGLVFELHRYGRRNDELVLGKLQALETVDRELRAIERVLDQRRDIVELREPGVTACPRCGALHGSDDNFCPQCGTPIRGPLAIAEVGGAPASGGEAQPAAGQEPPLPPAGAQQDNSGSPPEPSARATGDVASSSEQPTVAMPPPDAPAPNGEARIHDRSTQ
jgi:rubrerythrin